MEPPEDKGNDNKGQDNAAVGAAGDGGGNDDAKTITVKIDGEDREVTQEELVKGYGLESASRKRMEEAADIKKAAENDIQLASAMKRFQNTQDPQAIREVCKHLGVPDDQMEEFIKKATDGTDDTKGDDDDAVAPLNLDFGDLSPELQARIKKNEEAAADVAEGKRNALKDEIYGDCEVAVDKDEMFVTIKDESLLREVKQYVKNEVQRRVGLGGEQWPDVLGDVIQKARTLFKRFENQGDGAGDGQPGIPGVGPAAAMGSNIQTKEPVKPVSIDDPGYADNVGARFLQKLAKIATDKKE